MQAMESKLLVGGRTIVDHTNEQERELEERRRELTEQRRLERKMQQQLMMKEESTMDMQENYTSLRQEVDSKTKKLKKVTSCCACNRPRLISSIRLFFA